MDDVVKTHAEPQGDSAPARHLPLSSWLRWCGILLAIYVLSVGPAMKLCGRYPRMEPVILTIYTPLAVLCKSCKPAEDTIGWYLDHVWHAYK